MQTTVPHPQSGLETAARGCGPVLQPHSLRAIHHHPLRLHLPAGERTRPGQQIKDRARAPAGLRNVLSPPNQIINLLGGKGIKAGGGSLRLTAIDEGFNNSFRWIKE